MIEAALITSLVAAFVAVLTAVRAERRKDRAADAELSRERTETDREDEATNIQQQNRFIAMLQKELGKRDERINELFRREVECQVKVAALTSEIGHLQRQNTDQQRQIEEGRTRVRELEARLEAK